MDTLTTATIHKRAIPLDHPGRPVNHRWDAPKGKRLFSYIHEEHFVIGDYIVAVPPGYWFDGATVPRVFWPFFPPHGRAFEAASVHDYLYDCRGDFGEVQLSRRLCDDLFLMHMLADGVPATQAKIFYRCVVMFGNGKWNQDSFPDVRIPLVKYPNLAS